MTLRKVQSLNADLLDEVEVPPEEVDGLVEALVLTDADGLLVGGPQVLGEELLLMTANRSATCSQYLADSWPMSVS